MGTGFSVLPLGEDGPELVGEDGSGVVVVASVLQALSKRIPKTTAVHRISLILISLTPLLLSI